LVFSVFTQRELTVHVESYYTGNSPSSTNKLNVALLQNNTLGPQTGGGMSDEYVHQHRLVYLLTGQWGEDITSTSTGDFVDRTYTYTIPADYNGITAELADMEVVVFMTETTQELISGNGAFPTYSNFEYQNDASLNSVSSILDQCNNELAPEIEIQNLGANTISSLDIEYIINGTSHSYTWTGTLSPLQRETVALPSVSYDLQSTNNTLEVILDTDEDVSNNTQNVSFDEASSSNGTLTLEVNTDNWGTEVRWNIQDVDGNTLFNGGPYGNNNTYTEELDLPVDGCYTFNLIDTYGDGGGAVSLIDLDGFVIYETNGNYGSGETTNFYNIPLIVGIGENTLNTVSLFPNPAKNQFTVTNAENSTVTVYDLLGKVILSETINSNMEKVAITSLKTGTYFVNIERDGQLAVKKLIVE